MLAGTAPMVRRGCTPKAGRSPVSLPPRRARRIGQVRRFGEASSVETQKLIPRPKVVPVTLLSP